MQGDHIPLSDEAQLGKACGVRPNAGVMQFNESNGRLEMLIAEGVVERPMEAGPRDQVHRDGETSDEHAGDGRKNDDPGLG